MSDLIDRQDAIDALIKADYEFTGILSEPRARRFEQTINALPSALPELTEPTYKQVCLYCEKRCLSLIDNGLLKKYESAQPEPCGDVVSRNAIVQKLNEMDRYVSAELRLCDTDKKFPQNEVFIVDDVYEEIVEHLPSAQPEIIHCGECRYKDDRIDEDGIPFLKCLHGRSYGGTRINDFCSWAERRTDGV